MATESSKGRHRRVARIIGGVVLISLMGIGVGWAALPPGGTFIDDDGHNFEGAIEAIAAEGITKGCNPPANDKFCPNDKVTRGEMAVFLVRAMGYMDNGGGNLFVDDDGLFYENSADRLKTAKVTLGCNPPINDKYCGSRNVTRGEMAALLVRAKGYTDNGGGNLFTDDDGHLFENAIDKLGTAKVTLGCNPPVNDHFCPNDFVTRGQMAAFLTRALGLSPIVPPRSTADRPDSSRSVQIHMMYVLPSDGVDREFDIDGTLEASAAALQKWLISQTGGPGLRFDTFNGVPDITFYRLSLTDAELADRDPFIRDVIESELGKAGLLTPGKLYAVYYDGSSKHSCGGGAWPPLLVGQVAALYLLGEPPGAPACWTQSFAGVGEVPGYQEFAMLHEIVHTLGLVATCAPHHHLNGHASDSPRDLMWSGDAPWEIWRMELDVGRDDYFGHNLEGCSDLANDPFLTPTPAVWD